jgi:hypothetical protein
MDINELETYRLSDAIKYHDRLNPRLWGRDEHLLPEVREKLLEIAADFQEFLGIDVDVADITVSGSNAAYTYTDHSDIDLHLVVDLPRGDTDEVYRELFDAKKYQYNDRNDFRIGGYDVELYVQDPNKPHHSQGIYSVKHNKWIDVPKRRKPDVDDVSVRSKYEDLAARIESAIKSGDLDEMDAMAARIKELRAAGLAQHGEFGAENLAFKILRNNGTLEQLSAARKAARDARMSLDERRKKKKRGRKKYAYGSYWYPGYHYYGQSAGQAEVAADGGDGGESIRESQEESQQDVIERFARTCSDFLGIEQCPQIKLRRDPQWSRVNNTFGRYSPDTKSIELSVAGRHVVDVLRTLAHEMTHARQDEVVGLPSDAGETGSTYEDQANALAGQIMRHWAESEPAMFAGQHLDEQLDRPTPTAQEIIKKHSITEKDLIDQLKKGIAVEMEHTRDPRVALQIALDHLNERPDYYDMLAAVERPMGEGMREKIAGLATAACIAGTPGCATTDALKTVQTIGRAAKNLPTRAGAEEELRQAMRDQLRRHRGEVVPEDQDLTERTQQTWTNAQYEQLARQYARKYGVSERMVRHVMQKETGGLSADQRASARSSAGAIGVMQLMPDTAQELGVDPYDPRQNIEGGVRYLSQQLRAFGGNERLAMMAYNWGPGNVRRWQSRGSDPRRMPRETRNYIAGYQGAPTQVARTTPTTKPAAAQKPVAKSPVPKSTQAPKQTTPRSAPATEKPYQLPQGFEYQPQPAPSQRDSDSDIDLDAPNKMYRDFSNRMRRDVWEASGYIPTEKERNDPRYSMALTVDVQPGETGRQANKMGLKTDSQGRPGLLMKKLGNLLESVKRGEDVIAESEDLFEVKMSPGELQKWAESEEAQGIRAGFEAELIFRDTGREDEQESEPDYDQDERARDIESVVDFFQGGENGISNREGDRLRNRLYEEFQEWQNEQFYDSVWNERKYHEWVDDVIWRREKDEWRQRAADHLDLDIEAELTPEQTDRIEQTAQQMFREEAEEQWENQGPWYTEAEEGTFDEFRDEQGEEEWLDDNYRYMSDVENEFNLGWPYYTEGSDRQGGSRDPEDIADSLARSLGVKVVASSNYHSTRRRPDLWIIEPDGSLDPDDYEDTGLEVVSPPMPLPEALQKLREIIDWANDSNEGNAYTNSSTGLHMGVSLPFKGGDVDYVKLILFLGDKYVLDEFGRAANTYAASALEKLQEVQRKRRQNMSEADMRNMKGADKTAAAMDLMRKNLIELAARYVQDSVGQSKYTSAHLKDGYIEFRSPGGDYLSMDSRDEEALGNTMLRFARAMSLAGRPDLERKEYSKKLYKLLSGFKGAEISKPTQDTKYKTKIEYEDQQDAMDLFAKYASGQITPDELKKQWAQQVLAREMPEPAGEYEYEIVKDVSTHPDEPARREVVNVIRANGENEADRKVRELYGDESDYYKYSAQRRRYQYDVVNRDTGEVVGEVEDINMDRAINQAWDQFGPGGKNIPFDVREKPRDEPKKPLSRRGQVAKRLAEKPTLWTVKAGDREIFVMAPNTTEAKRQAQQQDPYFDRNRSYIDVRPSTKSEQEKYRSQQADNSQDLEQIQQRVTPGRGRYRVTWRERRDGEIVDDSLNIESDSAQAAEENIRRVLVAQGRVPYGVITAELVNTPAEQPTQQPAPQREYHIYLRSSNFPVVGFQAANDEAAMERLEQYRQQHPAINVGVRRGGSPASAGIEQPAAGEFTGQWQIRDNTGRVLHTFGGIGNNQADANRAALRWLTSNGYGSGTEVDVTPEMSE